MFPFDHMLSPAALKIVSHSDFVSLMSSATTMKACSEILPHLERILEESEGEGDVGALGCAIREHMCRKLEFLAQRKGFQATFGETCSDLEEYCEDEDEELERFVVDRQVITDCLSEAYSAQTEGRVVSNTDCWGAWGYQTGGTGPAGRLLYEEFFKLENRLQNNV